MNVLVKALIGIIILGLIWFAVNLLAGVIPAAFILIAHILIVVIAIVWLAQLGGFLNVGKGA